MECPRLLVKSAGCSATRHSFIQLPRCNPTSIRLQLSLYSAIYSRRDRHRGTEGIGLSKQSEVALWSKASPLSPSIKHHGVVCRLDSRKPNKLYTRLRYALVETFFFFCLALETLLQFFSSLTLAQKVVGFSYNSPTNSCGEPHLHVLKYTPNPNPERHGDDCIPYLSPTQLAWLLFVSNIPPSPNSPVIIFFFSGNTKTPFFSFLFFPCSSY